MPNTTTMKQTLFLLTILVSGAICKADPCHKDSFKAELSVSPFGSGFCKGGDILVEGRYTSYSRLGEVSFSINGRSDNLFVMTLNEDIVLVAEAKATGCPTPVYDSVVIKLQDPDASFSIPNKVYAGVPFEPATTKEYDDIAFYTLGKDSTVYELAKWENPHDSMLWLDTLGTHMVYSQAHRKGCYAWDSFEVTVEDTAVVFVPNAVILKGAILEKNEIFRGVPRFEYNNYTMRIFARNGTCVYECEGNGCAWKPSETKGIGVGRYVYIINLDDRDGDHHVLKGVVSVFY